MNDTTETILMEALDLLEQGMTADEIVARYPAQAAELRPFLLTATTLGNLAHQPPLAAQAQSKRAFLDAAGRAAVEPVGSRQPAGGWLRRLMAPALAVLLVLFLGGAGLVNASGAAVPGDALYQAKRWVEEVRLNLATNPETAAGLRERFRRERISEVERLLGEGRAAAVSLSGRIDALDGDRWTVAGVPVRIVAGTIIDGTPTVGALVQVDGRTADGGVVADRVAVLIADLTPEPAPAETHEPTPTPSPTLSPSPTDDSAPIAPMPSRPVASPPPSPVVSPTRPTATRPAPTATPDDDDDDDDGGDAATPDSDDSDDATPDDDADDDGGDAATPDSDDNGDNVDNGDNGDNGDDATPDSDDDATPDDATPDSDDDGTPESDDGG